MKLPIYIAVLALAQGLGARPSYLPGSPSSACMACHVPPAVPGGSATFLKINGTGALAPFGVTVSAGSSFDFEYRVTGFESASLPNVGGFIRPVGGTSGWAVSTGPLWTDNGQSAATPWSFQNLVAFGSGYGAFGYTPDDGSASDLNRLASDEVFSSTVQAPLAPGTYTLFAGAAHKRVAASPETAEVSMYVIVVAPSPTPTFSHSPTVTPVFSPTITLTPNLSETPTLTLTTTPSFSSSPTASPSHTLTPASGFPGIKQAALVPNPSAGTASLFLETLAAADSVEVRIYSASYGRSFTLNLGPFPGGKASLPLELPADMANGAYHAQVVARRGGKDAKSAILPLVVLK